MKNFISLLFLFLMSVQAVYAREFITEPLHSDNHFSSIQIPAEEELKNLLKGRDKELNVILNTLKTLYFCDGVISGQIYERYQDVLKMLPQEVSKKVSYTEKELLEKKNLKLVIFDIKSHEYYLPVRFPESAK